MKRFLAVELRYLARASKTHRERNFKAWYESLPAKRRGLVVAQARRRWLKRLGKLAR